MTLAPIGAVASAASTSGASRATPGGPGFGAILEARSSRVAPPTVGPAERISSAAYGGLQGIERAQARLDALLAASRSGRTFTAQELMAVQGEAYRLSQTVELSAKLVEQGAQAVKQALHAQV